MQEHWYAKPRLAGAGVPMPACLGAKGSGASRAAWLRQLSTGPAPKPKATWGRDTPKRRVAARRRLSSETGLTASLPPMRWGAAHALRF